MQIDRIEIKDRKKIDSKDRNCMVRQIERIDIMVRWVGMKDIMKRLIDGWIIRPERPKVIMIKSIRVGEKGS